MAAHEPTIHDDPDQPAEGLDDTLLPDRFGDRPLASRAYGITEAEQARGEGLRRKLARELPDVSVDDADVSADDEAPDLLSDSDDLGHDDEPELIGTRAEFESDDDYFGEHADRAPEETAMHVVGEPPGSTDRHAVRRSERGR